VRDFRKIFPKITLATDVICGFPGESEKAFEDTLKLIERVRPDVVNVPSFLPDLAPLRPKCAAILWIFEK